ncbi:hypothetical protein NTHI0544 [Haemophilus influenzae 86-028NP]|uniref:Uncharacterized protein n=1 Tax=Haemophilus influenzae (strain 86-028NP) TaxID=281310 RepID=Q4QNC4_HAEI8|nr:hypothetical protein NTHI0544 [Haemophilus influenzae 86-028NP]ABQ97670.1 hypothetical protein CGSHiEE_00900 [Haemophilus influenzae PittEE]
MGYCRENIWLVKESAVKFLVEFYVKFNRLIDCI